MSVCDGCVFCGRLAERGQRACGCHRDDLERVKACALASVHNECENKLTLGEVQEMRQRLAVTEAKYERDRASLLKVEQLIGDVVELIAKMRSEV